MKIHPSPPATPIAPTSTTEGRCSDKPERGGDRAAQVSLSEDARWVASVADEIRRAPEIRADVVASTRQALADGSYERSVDLDRVVDRMLADL